MSGDSGSTIKMEPAAIGLRIQTSIYGNCVPVVFGKTRVAGNLMWVGDFTAGKVSSGTTGGKGGGGSAPKTWNYWSSYMLALSEGPITAVAKAGWSDRNVVPNLTGDFTERKAVTRTATYVVSGARTVQVCPAGDFISAGVVDCPSLGVWLTAAADYNVNSTGLYTFDAGMDGNTVKITYSQYAFVTTVGLLTPFLGGYTQSAWSHMTTNHPTEAIAYRGIAYVAANSFDLGGSPDLPNLTFEVTGWKPFQVGVIDDADPKEVVSTILSEPHIGVNFPAAKLGDMTQFSKFCVANGLFISPAYNQQSPAGTIIEELLMLCNTSVFFSEDKLKFVPRSDTAITGNGVTYTPSTPVLYDFTDDDYLDEEVPVRVTRSSNTDAFNQLQVEYYDRASAYNQAVTEAKDQAAIDTFGLRPADSVTAHQIAVGSIARFVAQLLLQRKMYVRNTYEFRVGLQYCLLEPEDVITLTDAKLGMIKEPMRIVSIEEDEDYTLRIEVEDFPSGVSSAAVYASPTPAGYLSNLNVAPGDITTPILFEAPIFKTKSGLAVCAAVSSDSPTWGGASVYASYDGSTYKRIGVIEGGSRYGHLTSAITAAAGQVVGVKLLGKQTQITSGTADEAANMATSVLIGGEYAGYTTVALTGTGTYNLTMAARGGYSSLAAAHVAGERFVRMDDNVAISDDLDLDMIGKTIYFKFCSFNIYGGAELGLADVQAFQYTINGEFIKMPPTDVTGFTATVDTTSAKLTWNDINDPDLLDYEIRRGVSWAAGTVVTRVAANEFRIPPGTVGSVSYWIAARDVFLTYSLNPASATLGSTAPTAPNLSARFEDTDYVLEWNTPAALYQIDQYEIRYGSSWASGVSIGSSKTTVYRAPVLWGGLRTFWVAAIDAAGNVGAVSSASLTVTAPKAVTITPQVIDNFVLLQWTDATVTLPIWEYEIRRGTDYASATVIGTKQGLFTTVFETVSGSFTYWVVGIDSAVNYGTPASVNTSVNQPADYVLKANYDLHPAFSGTVVNGLKDGSTVLLPFLSTETVAQHFASLRVSAMAVVAGGTGYSVGDRIKLNTGTYSEAASATVASVSGGAVTGLTVQNPGNYSVAPSAGGATIALTGVGTGLTVTATTAAWATPGAQITAGYPLFIQPSKLSGYYEQDIDYGTVLAASKVTSTVTYQAVAGNPTLSTDISAHRYSTAVTLTIATPGVVNWTAHGRADGDPIIFSTTGALPTGLTAGVTYYVKSPLTNSFNVAATVGGSALAFTGTQSGTHTIQDPWVLYAGTSQVYITNFRYLRIRYTVATDSGDDILRITAANVKLDSKLKTISGMGTANAADSGGTIVYLTDDGTATGKKLFIDVDAIVPSAGGTSSVTAVYIFTDVPDPLAFYIMLFNSVTGARVSGPFSYTVRGS